MKPVPEQTECRRCEKLFCYFRSVGRPRIYCAPCAELERIDANEFNKFWQRQQRQSVRAA
jgi:late competence protein required for DNA uptake (superfamily II DNA/RNA helicase)